MQEYEQVRNNLIEMLEDLDDRLDKITNDVKHLEQPLDKDFAEQATQKENDEVIDALGNSARVKISKIKQAISRIDNGQYGQCVICGQAIKKARLDILPFSDKCIRCANDE